MDGSHTKSVVEKQSQDSNVQPTIWFLQFWKSRLSFFYPTGDGGNAWPLLEVWVIFIWNLWLIVKRNLITNMNRIINILYFTQWCDCTYWQRPCWLASLGRLAGFLYSDAILFVVIVVLTYFVMFSLFWWSNPKDVFCFSLQASLAHEPIIFNYLFSVDFPSHLVCVFAFVQKKSFYTQGSWGS